MSSFYSNLAATASALLKDKGQPMTLRKRGEPTVADPVLGTVTYAPLVDFTVHGVLLGKMDAFADGTLVKRGDRKALFEAGVAVPQVDDLLVAEGRTWTIIDLEAVSPDGTPVLFKLQVRA